MARARQILQGDGSCDTCLNINSTEVTIWQLISFKCSLLQEKSYLTLVQTNYKHILKICVLYVIEIFWQFIKKIMKSKLIQYLKRTGSLPKYFFSVTGNDVIPIYR